MERAGIRKNHDLEGIAPEQPTDGGESCYKRDQRCDGDRKWKVGNHDAGLYLLAVPGKQSVEVKQPQNEVVLNPPLGRRKTGGTSISMDAFYE